MKSLVIAALLGSACAPRAAPGRQATLARSSAIAVGSDEDHYWATQAALIDPKCWRLVAATPSTTLDVTVPDSRTWWTSNTFAVYLGEPHVVAQDVFPLSRSSGFLRELDARRVAMLPSGTRVRSTAGSHAAYVYYCDPEEVWSTDDRYTTDARGLYYRRLARLETLPLESAILEAHGGGALSEIVRMDVPVTGPILLEAVSAYDVAWCLLGWSDTELNVLSEINNSHVVRYAAAVLQPIPWRGTLSAVLQKASPSDGAGTYEVSISTIGTVTIPSSGDPRTAVPIKGSCSYWYWILPSDW